MFDTSTLGMSGSPNGGTVPYKAIFCWDIPLHRPYIGWVRFLKFLYIYIYTYTHMYIHYIYIYTYVYLGPYTTMVLQHVRVDATVLSQGTVRRHPEIQQGVAFRRDGDLGCTRLSIGKMVHLWVFYG